MNFLGNDGKNEVPSVKALRIFEKRQTMLIPEA